MGKGWGKLGFVRITSGMDLTSVDLVLSDVQKFHFRLSGVGIRKEKFT